jgi:hypothetical protein
MLKNKGERDWCRFLVFTVSSLKKDFSLICRARALRLSHSHIYIQSSVTDRKSLTDTKREISVLSKKNFQVEKDVRNLDNKIALLVRNKITLEEALAASGDIKDLLKTRTTKIKDNKQKEVSRTVRGSIVIEKKKTKQNKTTHRTYITLFFFQSQLYGQLFYLIQKEPKFVAALARIVKIGEIDNLLQTVMFTLYGNQYDDEEGKKTKKMERKRKMERGRGRSFTVTFLHRAFIVGNVS